jgi:hypothetical protein
MNISKNILKKTLIFWLPAFVLLVGLAYFESRGSFKSGAKDSFNGQVYENDGLGFSIVLPAEFKYFQTQRKESTDYTDLEIFVPTSDRDYPQEVPGYAKPLVIRIEGEDSFEKSGGVDENDEKLKIVGSRKGRIYAIKFWSKIPADFQGIWSELMKDDILQGFKLE